MTDVFISKQLNGATRRYNPAGYQDAEGRYVSNSLASMSNLDQTNPEHRYPLYPLQTPTPRTRWVKEYSNMGAGRPTLSNDRFEPCGPEKRIDFDSTVKQNVITHQKGWRTVEKGVHGWQWYDPSYTNPPEHLVDPEPEDMNWEGSRFKYGRYDVPANLGNDLPGYTASLQRDHGFVLTDYYRPSGYRAGGYLSGRNGISNDLGALPANKTKGPVQPA